MISHQGNAPGMPWSDEELKTRVAQRASEIGKTMRRTLDDAGLSHDTREKVPASGRRLDTLEKLAGALEWITLAWKPILERNGSGPPGRCSSQRCWV
jgi:hypothetical protein